MKRAQRIWEAVTSIKSKLIAIADFLQIWDWFDLVISNSNQNFPRSWMRISMLPKIAGKQLIEQLNSTHQLAKKPSSPLSERSTNSKWILAKSWSSEWRIHENDARRLQKNMKLLCTFWITSIICRLNTNLIISIRRWLYLEICNSNKNQYWTLFSTCLWFAIILNSTI